MDLFESSVYGIFIPSSSSSLRYVSRLEQDHLFDMMSPTDTKSYYDHDVHDVTMAVESASSLTHPPPTTLPSPYHDTFQVEERTVRTHRAHSWGSDDTLGKDYTQIRQPSPTQTKAYRNGKTDLDLEFLELDASYKHRTRRRPWIIFIVACSAVLVIVLVVLDMVLRMSQSTWPDSIGDDEDDVFRNWGQGGTGTEALSWYPTNFLQDVIPKPIHSHNDYWRKVPLFTAIHQGCTGVEADVWLLDETNKLYVGHDHAALQGNRTFQSLYIQPIVEILERANPTTNFYNGNSSNNYQRGVFDTNPNQTLTLLVDVKSAAAATWSEVVTQLAPLRERDWLSYVDANGTVHTRPVTVVGTGNTPFDQLVNSNTTYRDYFFDAPLNKLGDSDSSAPAPYDSSNSYYASVAFSSAIGSVWMGELSPDQIERIRTQVAQAHAKGLKARYWDLPAWPVQTRNMVWDVLVKEGVDYLNVDDVKTAAKRPWRY